MKKTLIIFLICLLTLNLCSCSPEKSIDSPDLETQYYTYAQQCIDNGDTEQASKVLEEGIEKTGSEKLKGLLNKLMGVTDVPTQQGTTVYSDQENVGTTTTTTKKQSLTNDFSKYVGKWYSPDHRQGNGGWELQLEIQIKDEQIAILLKRFDTFDYSSVAQVKKVLPLTKIKENALFVEYDNDGNDNSGTLEFVFAGEKIICISELNEFQVNKFGMDFYFGTETLVKEETSGDLFE